MESRKVSKGHCRWTGEYYLRKLFWQIRVVSLSWTLSAESSLIVEQHRRHHLHRILLYPQASRIPRSYAVGLPHPATHPSIACDRLPDARMFSNEYPTDVGGGVWGHARKGVG